MAVPSQVAELIRELARCTARGELDWYAPPDEVWATEQVYPGSPSLEDIVYPTTPVYTICANTVLVLRTFPGVRHIQSFSLDISNATRRDHVTISGFDDDSDLIAPLVKTFNAALLQAQVRDAADSADMINDLLDALRGT